MIETLYIEDNIHQHPRVQSIINRFPKARIITCSRYSEVFNAKAQNFRLQKQKPALILAEKYKNFVLETPAGYGIGASRNYYFSHMLNCLYDCRYCFLQGMYASANYVLFVNYEGFQQAIKELCENTPQEANHFFSGYDCDSLALEPVSGFAEAFLDFFAGIPNAWLELRTKSTQIRSLLARPVLPQCIVAFSLSPEAIANKVEDKAPSLQRRLEAMLKLQAQGWQVGLRFDPIIYQTDYQPLYRAFFAQVFAKLNLERLHSVSLGSFRLPEAYFKKMHKLYPDARLLAGPLTQHQGMVSYQRDLEQELLAFCTEQILNYLPKAKFFPCLA
ncbi:MAG: spore photoproduct lyase family protein [Methylococcaceae bacterium]|jgi:spore photoproduct lyase